MTFLDQTDSPQAVLTNNGRTIITYSNFGAMSYQYKGFSVGRGGYDVSNPVKIEILDPSDTSLIDQIYPVSGYTNFAAIENPFPNVNAFVCRINRGVGNYGLGELGLWVEILTNTAGPGPFTVGSLWLFAIAHFPIKSKTENDVFVQRLILPF